MMSKLAPLEGAARRAIAAAVLLAASLTGCSAGGPQAISGDDQHNGSGNSAPMEAGKGDIVGGGGRLDEIYRQIYTPGNPRWSDF